MVINNVTPSQHLQPQGQLSVTPGAAVTVTITDTGVSLFSWTAGEAETITISGTQTAGRVITLLITCDGTNRVMTFGSGFAAQGTFTLTASKVHTVTFISNGTTFYEVSRITIA